MNEKRIDKKWIAEYNVLYSSNTIILILGKGRENANNMVNITYNRGAKTVIGFSNIVKCHEMNYWSNEFFKGLRDTGNIGKALAYAKNRTQRRFPAGRTTDNPYVVGNKATLHSN